MVRTTSNFSPRQIEQRFLEQIIPKFTKNMPQTIRQQYKKQNNNNKANLSRKLVSIELMLVILFAATVTGTSIHSTALHLADMKQKGTFLSTDTTVTTGTTVSSTDLPDNYRINMDRIPDPHLVRKSLKHWKPKYIRSRYRKLIKEFITEMKHSRLMELIHGKFGDNGVSAAFDFTEVKYYGQDAKIDEFTVPAKSKSGAKYCHAYLTLQIVCPAFRLTLDVEPIYDDSPPIGSLMTKMLKRAKRAHLKIPKIYVDRGFYRAEILQTFNDELSRHLIMPAVRSPKIKKIIRSWYKKHGYEEGHKSVTIEGKSGHRQKYILVFKPKSQEKRKAWRQKKGIAVDDDAAEYIDQDFLYFCLLQPPKPGKTMTEIFDQIALEYTRRWGIETGYRVTKQVWAWTTSTSYNLRYWLMWTSVIVYNMWVLENLKIHDKDVLTDNPKRRKSKEQVLQEIEEYNCCGFPTKEEVEADKNRRTHAKLPASQRATNTFPSRPWRPEPKEPIRVFSGLILLVVQVLVNRWYDLDEQLKQGYDPPQSAK